MRKEASFVVNSGEVLWDVQQEGHGEHHTWRDFTEISAGTDLRLNHSCPQQDTWGLSERGAVS